VRRVLQDEDKEGDDELDHKEDCKHHQEVREEMKASDFGLESQAEEFPPFICFLLGHHLHHLAIVKVIFYGCACGREAILCLIGVFLV